MRDRTVFFRFYISVPEQNRLVFYHFCILLYPHAYCLIFVKRLKKKLRERGGIDVHASLKPWNSIYHLNQTYKNSHFTPLKIKFLDNLGGWGVVVYDGDGTVFFSCFNNFAVLLICWCDTFAEMDGHGNWLVVIKSEINLFPQDIRAFFILIRDISTLTHTE